MRFRIGFAIGMLLLAQWAAAQTVNVTDFTFDGVAADPAAARVSFNVSGTPAPMGTRAAINLVLVRAGGAGTVEIPTPFFTSDPFDSLPSPPGAQDLLPGATFIDAVSDALAGINIPAGRALQHGDALRVRVRLLDGGGNTIGTPGLSSPAIGVPVTVRVTTTAFAFANDGAPATAALSVQAPARIPPFSVTIFRDTDAPLGTWTSDDEALGAPGAVLGLPASIAPGSYNVTLPDFRTALNNLPNLGRVQNADALFAVASEVGPPPVLAANTAPPAVATVNLALTAFTVNATNQLNRAASLTYVINAPARVNRFRYRIGSDSDGMGTEFESLERGPVSAFRDADDLLPGTHTFEVGLPSALVDANRFMLATIDRQQLADMETVVETEEIADNVRFFEIQRLVTLTAFSIRDDLNSLTANFTYRVDGFLANPFRAEFCRIPNGMAACDPSFFPRLFGSFDELSPAAARTRTHGLFDLISAEEVPLEHNDAIRARLVDDNPAFPNVYGPDLPDIPVVVDLAAVEISVLEQVGGSATRVRVSYDVVSPSILSAFQIVIGLDRDDVPGFVDTDTFAGCVGPADACRTVVNVAQGQVRRGRQATDVVLSTPIPLNEGGRIAALIDAGDNIFEQIADNNFVREERVDADLSNAEIDFPANNPDTGAIESITVRFSVNSTATVRPFNIGVYLDGAMAPAATFAVPEANRTNGLQTVSIPLPSTPLVRDGLMFDVRLDDGDNVFETEEANNAITARLLVDLVAEPPSVRNVQSGRLEQIDVRYLVRVAVTVGMTSRTLDAINLPPFALAVGDVGANVRLLTVSPVAAANRRAGLQSLTLDVPANATGGSVRSGAVFEFVADSAAALLEGDEANNTARTTALGVDLEATSIQPIDVLDGVITRARVRYAVRIDNVSTTGSAAVPAFDVVVRSGGIELGRQTVTSLADRGVGPHELDVDLAQNAAARSVANNRVLSVTLDDAAALTESSETNNVQNSGALAVDLVANNVVPTINADGDVTDVLVNYTIIVNGAAPATVPAFNIAIVDGVANQRLATIAVPLAQRAAGTHEFAVPIPAAAGLRVTNGGTLVGVLDPDLAVAESNESLDAGVAASNARRATLSLDLIIERILTTEPNDPTRFRTRDPANPDSERLPLVLDQPFGVLVQYTVRGANAPPFNIALTIESPDGEGGIRRTVVGTIAATARSANTGQAVHTVFFDRVVVTNAEAPRNEFTVRATIDPIADGKPRGDVLESDDFGNNFADLPSALGTLNQLDTDGDGLPDLVETTGFTVSRYVVAANRDAADAAFRAVGADIVSIATVTPTLFRARVAVTTDPTRADTDGDGIDDFSELVTFAPGALANGVVPGLVDKNGAAVVIQSLAGAGVNGRVAATKPVLGIRTDPTRADSDGDGVPDTADPAPQLNPDVFLDAAAAAGMRADPSLQSLLVNFDQDGDGFLEAPDSNLDGVPDFTRYNEAVIEQLFGIDFSNDGTLDDGFDIGGPPEDFYVARIAPGESSATVAPVDEPSARRVAAGVAFDPNLGGPRFGRYRVGVVTSKTATAAARFAPSADAVVQALNETGGNTAPDPAAPGLIAGFRFEPRPAGSARGAPSATSFATVIRGNGRIDASDEFFTTQNGASQSQTLQTFPVDNCPGDASDPNSAAVRFNETQADFDNDGIGDACDPDLDNDGISNGFESATGNCGAGLCGFGALSMLPFTLLGIGMMKRRYGLRR